MNDSDENNREKQEEEENNQEVGSEAPLQQKISPLEIQIVNKLQIVQFLDNIIEDPLLFVYNDTVQRFMKEIENFIVSLESDFKEIWKENKKELDNILNYSKELASQNGYKRSIQKDALIWSIPIYGIAIGFTILIYFFNLIPQDYSLYALMGVFLLLCISNSLVSKFVLNRRMKFRAQKTPFLKEQMKESLEQVRNVNQIILNDIKDLILENNFEPTKFKAFLYNKNYANIKVLETRQQQNVPFYQIGIDVSN